MRASRHHSLCIAWETVVRGVLSALGFCPVKLSAWQESVARTCYPNITPSAAKVTMTMYFCSIVRSPQHERKCERGSIFPALYFSAVRLRKLRPPDSEEVREGQPISLAATAQTSKCTGSRAALEVASWLSQINLAFAGDLPIIEQIRRHDTPP